MNNIGILSIKSKTARLLAEALDVPMWRGVVPLEASYVIRWGNTTSLDIVTLNSANAIRLASNKRVTREKLQEANLPIPQFTTENFPIVGRPDKHAQGKHFYFCENEEELQRARERGATYFSEYYPKQNEYRVHVANGKVLLFSIKEGDKTKLIWNKRKSGFTFRHMKRSEWLENEQLMAIQRSAKRAIEVLGLDFGAVDILADAPAPYPSFVISEINTAPSLSPLAINKYAKYFQSRISDY